MIPNHRSRHARPSASPLSAAACLLLLAVGACADSTGPEQSVEPQDQILFVSNRAGNVSASGQPISDMYRMNADGSGVERLTTQSGVYRSLRLSPDGKNVTYYSDAVGCYNIWVMNLEDAVQTQLTGVNGFDRCNEMPRWSPDGSKIAFISSRHPEVGWDVYVMNADGSGVVNVSNNPSTDSETFNESVEGWSPDGRVVILSYRTGAPRLYLANAEGSGIEPLFDGEDYRHAYWSPDGAMLLTVETVEGGSSVMAMQADGSGALNVGGGTAFDAPNVWAPTPWSPDGSMAAFQSSRTGNDDVFVVRADGTGLVNVSNDPGDDMFLDWTGDGHLLFSSARGGGLDIYRVDVDGTHLVNLTNAPGSDDGSEAIWVRRQ